MRTTGWETSSRTATLSRSTHGDTIRVLSVPAGHVYVRHLTHPEMDDGVRRLPDPVVSPHVPASQWWPPPALDPEWLAPHLDDFDLLHLHFGFDAQPPDRLVEVVSLLRGAGKPFVYTVHDLRNPHHETSELHDRHLDVLVPAADELVTLTHGAAAAIRRRWDVQAEVLPHPHVVDPPTLWRERPQRDEFVVGVHLKSLRSSMAPVPVVRALADVVSDLPGARLRINVHTDVMTPGSANHDPDVVRLLELETEAGRIELQVHDFFDDDTLWNYFQELDLSVLPYRFGTHSGWLEACYDLGTAVLAPTCGFFAEQRPCLTYRMDSDGLDEDSLVDAVRLAYETRPAWRADPTQRFSERVGLSAAHRDLYERLLA